MMYSTGFTRTGAIFYSYMGKLLFLANAILCASAVYIDEQRSRERFKAQRAVEVTQSRTESILNTLMPPLVVEELRNALPNAPPPSHKYRHATIAQSDLCGFTALSSTRSPAEVVEFIGEIFGLFDVLTDKHEVYKVETVGDAYIAGQADKPLTEKNSSLSVCRFALDMVFAVKKWSHGHGLNVNCRVGVHHGECVGGIVGNQMQRYHLFGELMTVIEVLESTAPEGGVQMSKACKEEVEREIREEGSSKKDGLKFEMRTEPHLTTSKGEVHEYNECGGTTYIVQASGVRFESQGTC
jgi:class 3 adenylate cyclase